MFYTHNPDLSPFTKIVNVFIEDQLSSTLVWELLMMNNTFLKKNNTQIMKAALFIILGK